MWFKDDLVFIGEFIFDSREYIEFIKYKKSTKHYLKI